MSEPMERHSRLSITRSGLDGVSHTEVHVTEVFAPARADCQLADETEDPGAGQESSADCFDPFTCCSPCEQAMIAALRAYLRPDQAPECLVSRLKTVLDDCCGCR